MSIGTNDFNKIWNELKVTKNELRLLTSINALIKNNIAE